jgi:hypothetical protein
MRAGLSPAMTIHNRIEPERHRNQDFWPRSRPRLLIEMRRHRRGLRWANIGFGLIAFLLLAVSVLSILYVGPSPMPAPGARPLHSHPAAIR